MVTNIMVRIKLLPDNDEGYRGDKIMRYEVRTRNVCSSRIAFDLNGDVVKNVVFTGGCNGKTEGCQQAG